MLKKYITNLSTLYKTSGFVFCFFLCTANNLSSLQALPLATVKGRTSILYDVNIDGLRKLLYS